MHLNRNWYFLFAEEVVEEVCRVHQQHNKEHVQMPQCMIPPISRVKSQKEKAPERRQYLQKSAENYCKFTRPYLIREKNLTIRESAHTSTSNTRSSPEPDSVSFCGPICPATFPSHAGFYYLKQLTARPTGAWSLSVPNTSKPYVQRKKASKLKTRRVKRTRKRRQRKKKHKVCF